MNVDDHLLVRALVMLLESTTIRVLSFYDAKARTVFKFLLLRKIVELESWYHLKLNSARKSLPDNNKQQQQKNVRKGKDQKFSKCR